MGLLSKVRKKLKKSIGGKILGKALSKDPLTKKLLKKDPLGRRIMSDLSGGNTDKALAGKSRPKTTVANVLRQRLASGDPMMNAAVMPPQAPVQAPLTGVGGMGQGADAGALDPNFVPPQQAPMPVPAQPDPMAMQQPMAPPMAGPAPADPMAAPAPDMQAAVMPAPAMGGMPQRPMNRFKPSGGMMGNLLRRRAMGGGFNRGMGGGFGGAGGGPAP